MSNYNGLPPSMIETIAGFTAGIISTLAVHPLDVIKTRLQVDRISSSRVGNSYRIARDIARHEGSIAEFYRGLTPNLIGNSNLAPRYGKLKDGITAYRSPQDGLSTFDYFVAAGGAGTVSHFSTTSRISSTVKLRAGMTSVGALTALCTNPIWVIKTRMLSTGSSHPGAYTSMSDGVRQILRTEGLSGFYSGLLPSLVGVSHGAVQFMAYEQLKNWKADEGDRRQELGNLDYLWLSALSKVFAGSVTYPYQVVRARLQTYDARKTYEGARDVVVQVWRQEGVSGFYKGSV
ncbi:MAG: hypothetical protein M1835_006908 [Candelina submexicana]|nr:MAG: hypothetical protein M1835_006908 [Candelina submexicana]